MGPQTESYGNVQSNLTGIASKKPIPEPAFNIKPVEDSEKASFLAKIDEAIKCGTDNVFSTIDRLSANKKQLCDLRQLRSEVESGRIGEGAKAIVELALRYLW